MEDEGKYACNAGNSIGSNEIVARVYVRGNTEIRVGMGTTETWFQENFWKSEK